MVDRGENVGAREAGARLLLDRLPRPARLRGGVPAPPFCYAAPRGQLPPAHRQHVHL